MQFFALSAFKFQDREKRFLVLFLLFLNCFFTSSLVYPGSLPPGSRVINKYIKQEKAIREMHDACVCLRVLAK